MNYADFQKTPIEAIDQLEKYVKEKVVYDIGAGDGTFAKAISQYAKKVVAVEMMPDLAMKCREWDLETIEGDFVDVDLKEADVLFVFLSMIGNYILTEKLKREGWKGIVISHFHPLQSSPMDIIDPDEVININNRFPFLIYEIKYERVGGKNFSSNAIDTSGGIIESAEFLNGTDVQGLRVVSGDQLDGTNRLQYSDESDDTKSPG